MSILKLFKEMAREVFGCFLDYIKAHHTRRADSKKMVMQSHLTIVFRIHLLHALILILNLLHDNICTNSYLYKYIRFQVNHPRIASYHHQHGEERQHS